MNYISTRGLAPVLDFEGAMLSGLARDGGLYVPETFPKISRDELKALRGKPYADVAFAIVRKFTDGSIPDVDVRNMIDAAYATFNHPATTPLNWPQINIFSNSSMAPPSPSKMWPCSFYRA
jgi:threonine synthase